MPTANEAYAEQAGLVDGLKTTADGTTRDDIARESWPGLDVVPTSAPTASAVHRVDQRRFQPEPHPRSPIRRSTVTRTLF
jgi:hypothetical protein